MPRRVLAAVIAVLAVSSATPAHAQTPTTTAPPTPTSPPAPSTLPPPAPSTLPPPAPRPTAAGNSPTAPDPHPQLGGIGPDGQTVGGPRLRYRGTIVPADAPRLPAGLTARAWVLTDLDTGQILAARDPHGRYQPASILKALTCLVLLPQLDPRHVVVASSSAANAEGSAVGLVPGGRYTVETLFRALLMMSGNDAATALAQAAGGVPTTVSRMNTEARALGAYDTFVQTPSGLDGWQQLTSAYDMALVLQAVTRMQTFLSYDHTVHTSLPAQHVGARRWGAVPLYNQSQDWFDAQPGALMAKTGFTDAAQHTFLGAARVNGHRLGVVFLRAQRYPLDQWQQAQLLLKWAAALPSGTASVGTLAGAVTSTTTPTSAPNTPTPSTTPAPTTPHPPAGHRRQAAARTSAPTHSVTSSLAAGAAAVLVLAALTWLLARRRRNHT